MVAAALILCGTLQATVLLRIQCAEQAPLLWQAAVIREERAPLMLTATGPGGPEQLGGQRVRSVLAVCRQVVLPSAKPIVLQ